ncbi:hypothetical protein ASZ90_006893 [hydrocarbon metagenome]|uniref:Uncharacterized protein n=1 Tax=hydrocarbon metagenome TaxID=938273 RepID=A0A0W8FR55_9ZZZZ
MKIINQKMISLSIDFASRIVRQVASNKFTIIVKKILKN